MNVACARRAVVLVAGLAILSLQVVRAEHIHPAGIEGRTQSVVHSHGLVGATAGTRAYAAHGDHRFAIYLAPIYESVLGNSYHPPSSDLAPPDHRRGTDPLFRSVGTVQERSDRHPPGIVAGVSDGRAPPLG